MKSMILVMMPTLLFIGALFSYLKIKKVVDISKEESKKWLTGLGIGLATLILLISSDYISSAIILKNIPEETIEISELTNMSIDENNMITYNNNTYRLKSSNNNEHISLKTVPQKAWGIFGTSYINISSENISKIKYQ